MTTDQHPTQPLPDPGAQWVLSQPTEPRRDRRWPWLIGLLLVVVLAFVAWFAGEQIARGIIERTIREQAITQLALPADQQIDVDVASPVLLPLLAGNIGAVRVASDDVPLGDTSADIVVEAQDVPVRGEGDWSGAYATVTLDEQQLQDLLASVDGFPAATVGLDAPDVTAEVELQALVTTVPVGVALTPRVENGDIVLTPSTLRLGGAEISAEAILRQFGAIASTVVRDWDVCIADQLPEAFTLTDLTVERATVVAQFEIDSSIMREGAAARKGTCD